MALLLPILLSVVATILYIALRPRMGAIGLVLLNFVIYGIASIWWFFLRDTDGLSQVLGVAIFAGAFVILSIIGSLLVREKNRA
ncbi:hypothetical protein JJB07_09175 [Tumebacillus sp. ITR2]|uniref:DUF2651 domain-containing protein n=1 Tax=Tumebacillus amylolyticus TaxID=2801339 RepID=A0ABS1J9V5_9BACL|nr:hypothetical protein [Tumebacillus amylolyticus]MBL0386824.1 hypothetical protein [Tumebacillus amylolyticus]